MQTFDLLLFRGSDIISQAISIAMKAEDGTNAPDFTHVGCVFLGKDLLPILRVEEQNWLRKDQVYVYESTLSGKFTDGVTDITNQSRFGVQLRLLDEVVQNYDISERSRLAWAPLRKELRDTINVKKMARVEYEKYKGLQYDASIIDLAAAVNISGARTIRDNSLFSWVRDFCCCCCYRLENKPSDWQFCSELVANIYKDLGIIPDNVIASNVIPTDLLCDPDQPDKTFDADKQIPPVCLQFVRFHK